MRDLQAFSAARNLWGAFEATLGPDHPATASLRVALVRLGQGCHRFHESDKRDAYADAREHAAEAAVLALLSGVEGVDTLVDTLEQDVLASLAGLIRRAERGARRNA